MCGVSSFFGITCNSQFSFKFSLSKVQNWQWSDFEVWPKYFKLNSLTHKSGNEPF